MPEHHLSTRGGHLRDRPAATIGENLFAELFERDNVHAAETVEAGVAGQLALSLKRRLLRDDPIDRRPERIARDCIDDRSKAAMRLTGTGATNDETNRHLNSPLTAGSISTFRLNVETRRSSPPAA